MRIYDRKFVEEMRSTLGVDLLGVAPIGQSTPAFLREQAHALLPGAKSVFVFAKEMYPEVVALLGPSKELGEAEKGELFGPHCDYLNGRLMKAVYDLSEVLRKDRFRTMPLPAFGTPVDQRYMKAVFSFKDAACAAGMGSIGRHSMLVTPQFGPRVRLACLLTDAQVEPTPETQVDYCRKCEACIRVCPAGALQTPQEGEACSMNKFACRTYRLAGLTCSVCLKTCAEALSRKKG